MITVSGRLQIRTWKDNNGNARKNAEILTGNVYFCGSKVTSNNDSAKTYDGNSPRVAPTSDFAMLDGDDPQLPY